MSRVLEYSIVRHRKSLLTSGGGRIGASDLNPKSSASWSLFMKLAPPRLTEAERFRGASLMTIIALP